MPLVDDQATPTIYETAETLAQLGLSVIPIAAGTKEPPRGFSLREYRTRHADASERYEWFQEQGHSLAVMCGSISGNLTVLDFDTDGGYEAFAERHPSIRSLPRVRTRRGHHVWLRTSEPTRKYNAVGPDGDRVEVRGEDHYVLVPPSPHPGGGAYAWERAPQGGIPRVNLATFGLKIKSLEPEPDTEPVTEGTPLSEHEIANLRRIITPHYVEGQRHNLWLALAGWLAYQEVPESDTVALAQEIMQRAGQRRDEANVLPAIRDTYAKAREGISVAGWSYLTDRKNPLVSESAAKELELLLRGRNPEVRFDLDDNATDEERSEHPRFVLIHVQDMKARKPPPQLVQGVLARGSMAALIGDSGTYKSFLALDLALHIGAGLDWFGRPVEPGPVIYIAAEGAAGMSARIRAWEIAHETPAENCWFLTDAVQIPDPHEVAAFLDAAGGLDEPPVLVVIDTLARTSLGMEENSSKEMMQFVAGAQHIQDATGAIPLIVHHHNRQGSYRGSTAIRAALDTMLEMRRDPDHEGIVVLSCDKQKDLDMFDPIHLRPDVIEVEPGDGVFPGLTSVVLERADAPEPAFKGNRNQVYEILRERFPLGAQNREWLDACMGAGVPERTFYRIKKELMKKGHVTANTGVYIVAEP